MIFIAVLLVLGSASFAQRPVNNNQQIDSVLRWHNQLLTSLGYGVSTVNDVNLGVISLEQGVQIGMNSLVRRGDSYVWRVGSNSFYFSNRLGYGLLAYAFGKITYNSESFAGILQVKENEFQFDYLVNNETGNCSVILVDYRFTEFDDLELSTSSERYKELDIEELVGDEDNLLPIANGLINLDRKPMEAHLQGICRRPLPQIPLEPEED